MARKDKKLPRGIYVRKGVVYIRFAGQDGRIVRESTEQSNIEVAKKVRDKRKTEVAMGTYFPTRRYEDVTFGVLLKEYWEDDGRYTRTCFKYLKPRIEKKFAGMKARQMTPKVISEFLRGLEREGRNGKPYSPAYVNSHRTLLGCAFSHAVKFKTFDYNPVAAVRQRKADRRRRCPTIEEFRKLRRAFQELGDLELDAFALLAAVTACRKSEILERRWADLDLEHDPPYIYIPETKNGDPKTLPLPDVAVRVLKGLPSYGKRPYVFPVCTARRFRGRKQHRWDIRKAWMKGCKQAGLEDLHPHDLRRLAASILLNSNVGEARIKKFTGHRSSRVLSDYQFLDPELKRQTVDLIAEKLCQ